MTDYQIQPNTRRCAVSGRELRAGEKFYSVLVDEGEHWQRRDYAAEAWPGAPADAFSFWSGRVPPADGSEKPKFDDDMLLDCFTRLESETDPRKINFRYVVALLLMRRRVFKFEQTIWEADHEKLLLRCTRTGGQYQVVDPRLSEQELEKVQEDVFQAL